MSNFIVPNTFVPGTKAKAQEVNENFIAVQDELNKKVEKEGDPTQPLVVGDAVENNQAATKGQVETYTKSANTFAQSISDSFLVRSGNVDSDGESDIIDYENGVVSFKVDSGTLYAPLVVVPANLQSDFTVTSLNSIDLSAYQDGVYNIFVKSDGTAYALCNTIYVQKVAPTPALNTIFVDISKSPLTVQKYDGEKWENFNDVYLGNVTLVSGVVTDCENCQFNNNGFNVNRANNHVIIDKYTDSYSGYLVYSGGLCEQWGYSVNVSDALEICLLKTYRDGAYNIQITSAVASNANIHDVKAMTGSGNKTTSSFKIVKKDSANETIYWRTVGYLYY